MKDERKRMQDERKRKCFVQSVGDYFFTLEVDKTGDKPCYRWLVSVGSEVVTRMFGYRTVTGGTWIGRGEEDSSLDAEAEGMKVLRSQTDKQAIQLADELGFYIDSAGIDGAGGIVKPG